MQPRNLEGREPTGDITRSANVANNAFDLGSIDPSNSVSVEATLRTESGAAVGYGLGHVKVCHYDAEGTLIGC